jgi:pSer/pThr/pTyr-binding forkhead associated (FHA) protein
MTDGRRARPGMSVETGWLLVPAGANGPSIRLVFGRSELEAHPIGLTIGRHHALAERVLDDPSISRRHARLALDGADLVIEDLNSLNGTAVDGEELDPFSPHRLAPGQTLVLGALEMRVEALGEDETGA